MRPWHGRVSGAIPDGSTRQEIASKRHSPRFARRPNRKEFWAKKSVGDSAFWEKKIFNHMNQKGFANIILVVVIVILVGVVGYFVFVKKSEPIAQQLTPTPTKITTPTKTPVSPTPTSGVKTKSVDLAGKYTVNVPVGFTVTEVSKAITKVPVYALVSPDGHNISILVHSYLSAGSQIPGECVVSNNFDAGTLSAPIFCEGLNLVDSLTISGNRYVKYGTVISDTSLDCTMNSPCPIKVPVETRYSKEYVFVVSDKSRSTIVEFFAGDAARGPSNTVNGFEGVSATLHDIIIPSLSAK